MSPKQFLKHFRRDERLASGRFFPDSPLVVDPSERLGVVLLNLGGPYDRSEVDDFLFQRWMDPVLEGPRIRKGRSVPVRIAARIGARFLWRDYDQIGGECPINRLTREQASALQEHLNERLGRKLGIGIRTYIAMRYGRPSSEEAALQMVDDAIDKVILLPLYPQYAMATTGSSLAYWSVMLDVDGIVKRQTAAVVEYSTHPKYVRALSERIDEALQRFPRRVRNAVEIVFCAEQPALGGDFAAEESFCHLVRETVGHVARLRDEDREYRVSFFDSGRRKPDKVHRGTKEVLRELADRDSRSVLVVPLGLSTDHVWTAYGLDIGLRQEAKQIGISMFEVASAMNCHPLFIDALADIVGEHVTQHTEGAARSAGVSANSSDAHRASGLGRVSSMHFSSCSVCNGPVRSRNWGT